jgi:pimeloyl-ACP methyl ester carboxylesterase
MFEVPTTLHTIEAPVLFVQGTADPLTGQVLRYLPLIPHARLRLLPGSNHVPISDDPAGLVLHMKDFLAQIGS